MGSKLSSLSLVKVCIIPLEREGMQSDVWKKAAILPGIPMGHPR